MVKTAIVSRTTSPCLGNKFSNNIHFNVKDGRWHITPQKAIYKWYINGIIILPIGGWTMPPSPPFMGTRNNH